MEIHELLARPLGPNTLLLAASFVLFVLLVCVLCGYSYA
jgi:hypothetical protein